MTEIPPSYFKNALAIFGDALGSIGIYPAMVNGVTRTEYAEGRTEYEKGWNAAYTEISHHLDMLREVLARPSDVTLMKVEMAEWCFVDIDKGKFNISVNSNDFFYWACADDTPLTDEDVRAVYPLFKKYGRVALDAYACAKRDQQPQEPVLKSMLNAYPNWHEIVTEAKSLILETAEGGELC